MKNFKTKFVISILLLLGLVFIPLQSDAGTTLASRQLADTPTNTYVLTTDGTANTWTDPTALGTGVNLDDAYDNSPSANKIINVDDGEIDLLNPGALALTTDGFIQIRSSGSLDVDGTLDVDGISTFDEAFIFNNTQANTYDARFAGDTEANLLFIDTSADRIGIGTSTPSYLLDIIGDVASESAIVNSSAANSGGGLQTLFSEATSGALSGATGTIQVNVPIGSKILGVQIRVDTTVTGAVAMSISYSGGSSQLINAAMTLIKNDKFNIFYNVNADTDIASSEVDITLTAVGPNFSAGDVRAIVYYKQMITMDNNP